MTCLIPSSEVQCRQSEARKTLPIPVGKRRWQGLGSVSDHRTYHTPPRTTRKQHGQRGLKMKWCGAEIAKNGRKYPKKVSGAGSHPRGRRFDPVQVHQKQESRPLQRTTFLFFYPISCSMFSNKASSKNSRTVIFSPTHIFATVVNVGLLLPVLMMLFKVDCVKPDSRASLLIVILLASHKSRIRCFTASRTFTFYNTFMQNSILISL